MYVVEITLDQAEIVADALNKATSEVFVAYDPIDDAFKVKIDGGTWSPPFRSAG